MIEKSLFNVPYWKMQIINFEEKKKELTKILESYPEVGFNDNTILHTFHSNRQNDRSGLSEKFLSIMNEEVDSFAKTLKNRSVFTNSGHTFILSNGNSRTDKSVELFEF